MNHDRIEKGANPWSPRIDGATPADYYRGEPIPPVRIRPSEIIEQYHRRQRLIHWGIMASLAALVALAAWVNS